MLLFSEAVEHEKGSVATAPTLGWSGLKAASGAVYFFFGASRGICDGRGGGPWRGRFFGAFHRGGRRRRAWFNRGCFRCSATTRRRNSGGGPRVRPGKSVRGWPSGPRSISRRPGLSTPHQEPRPIAGVNETSFPYVGHRPILSDVINYPARLRDKQMLDFIYSLRGCPWGA